MNDAGGSPELVFEAARSALADELAAAFVCLDRPDLVTIASNSVRALSTSDPGFEAVCERFGFDTVTDLHDLRRPRWRQRSKR